MPRHTRWVLSLVLGVAALGSIVGCGSGGGDPGDENDPEKTTDIEQMADETDKRLNSGQGMGQQEE